MIAANTASAYKTQQIMTASPEDLTLMLYNGALRFVTESIKALEAGNLPQSHQANLRAQDIVKEFMCTLNMDIELSKGMYQLYDYINFRLIQGNIKKDTVQLEEARGMLQELRDTWMQAMKLARAERMAIAK